MKKASPFLYLAALGIIAISGVALVVLQPPALAVLADLPSHAGELDMSHIIGIPEPGEELSGGMTTVRDTGMHAFGRVPMNLTSYDTNWLYFREGRVIFENEWYVVRKNRLLLGPQFNAISCATCHEFDGRGRPPLTPNEAIHSLVIRLSVPHGAGYRPEPTYGEQLGYYSSADSIAPEGRIGITYEDVEGRFADGASYRLRLPSYQFRDLGYGPLASDLQYSPRVAAATFGLGLLEAIPEQTILSFSDPEDRNGDGISGRPNYVQDDRTRKKSLGRFGWKANQPTLQQQIYKAFLSDMGISSAMYPDDGSTAHAPAQGASSSTELEESEFDRLLFYIKLLAVPARRNWKEPAVQRGKSIFRTIGCAGCHIPEVATGVMDGYPELSNQTIRPYTDLLLHDMGEGLADHRPDGLADGREWRTPPLWGIGLIRVVNRHTFFLHDGRARNLEEAILWHGGEAETAQNNYRRLRKEDRSTLIAFLESL